MKKIQSIAGLAFGATLALSACSGSTTDEAAAVEVTTAFYPLSYLVSAIGGNNVTVTDLTPSGGDAHGVELSPKEVADMAKTDVLFYIATMSSAIDDAAETSGVKAVELGEHVDLLSPEDLHAEGKEHAHEHAEGEEHAHEHTEGEEHAHEDEHAEEHAHEHEAGHSHDGHDHGDTDPHFWTDPGRMVLAAQTVRDELIALDPDNEATYTQNAETVIADLEALDAEFASALDDAQCSIDSFVVTHEAFGYLAHEYGLNQIGIAGLDPELEPSPARIAEIKDLVDDLGITTIFTSTNGEKKVADTVAAETGAKAEVLDVTATQLDPNVDYIGAMEKNLQLLSESMGCQAK